MGLRHHGFLVLYGSSRLYATMGDKYLLIGHQFSRLSTEREELDIWDQTWFPYGALPHQLATYSLTFETFV